MSEILTFGKYKGQPCEILAGDKQYCDWLCSQDWFRNKYINVYNIISNFTVSEDTPDHNRMQALFLKDVFITKLAEAIFNFDYLQEVDRKLLEEQKKVLGSIRACRYSYIEKHRVCDKIGSCYNEEDYLKACPCEIDEKNDYEKYHKFLEKDMENTIKNIVPEFEVNGWDVRIKPECGYFDECYFELKPSVGDDYPTILREMKKHRNNIMISRSKNSRFFLIYDNFTAEGVTEVEMKTIFGNSNFSVIPLASIK